MRFQRETCTSEDADLKRSRLWDPREKRVLVRMLILKEVDCEILCDWREEQVPARTLDSEMRWIVRSHIDWEEKQVSARALVPKKDRWWDPTSVRVENETLFIRVWKSVSRCLPSLTRLSCMIVSCWSVYLWCQN